MLKKFTTEFRKERRAKILRAIAQKVSVSREFAREHRYYLKQLTRSVKDAKARKRRFERQFRVTQKHLYSHAVCPLHFRVHLDAHRVGMMS